MKLKLFIALIVAMFACISMPTMAGVSNPGGVYIETNAGITSLTGLFNVRYNPNVTQGYIFIGGGEGNSIGVFGQDSRNGTNFFCVAFSTDASYAALQRIIYGGVNGTSLIVSVKAPSSTCLSPSQTKDSRNLN